MGSSLQYARWSVDPNRVIVMDAPTGCCLFDKKYRWRTAVTSHSVCNLLRSFLQLSRDIDCGELHSAQFAIADEQMELIVARSDRVFLALFHDVTNPAVYARETAERMIRSLLNEFERSFVDVLKNFSEMQLKKAYNGDLELEASIFAAFENFEEFVSQTVSKFSSGKAEDEEQQQPPSADEDETEGSSTPSEATAKSNIEQRTPQHYRTMPRGYHSKGHQSYTEDYHPRRLERADARTQYRADTNDDTNEVRPGTAQPAKVRFKSTVPPSPSEDERQDRSTTH
eukprot:gb/GECG01007330.1/.p1 GENE.gb/GECG01007330.1/~~gb/GECG01007330.1/.p1  ORF type:complete len:284 (+),score=42.35 gb/GECG01007330.1/:1-852(+)